MLPAQQDIPARNNAPLQLAIALTLPDGSAFDFGDYTPLTFEVKVDPYYPVGEIKVTGAPWLSVEPDGALGINIPEALMTPLDGPYVYEVRGVDAAGDNQVLLEGAMPVTQGVIWS